MSTHSNTLYYLLNYFVICRTIYCLNHLDGLTIVTLFIIWFFLHFKELSYFLGVHGVKCWRFYSVMNLPCLWSSKIHIIPSSIIKFLLLLWYNLLYSGIPNNFPLSLSLATLGSKAQIHDNNFFYHFVLSIACSVHVPS